MKITFNDKSFIECIKSNDPGKVIFTISAKDGNNALKQITNSVEITLEEFKQLILDIQEK